MDRISLNGNVAVTHQLGAATLLYPYLSNSKPDSYCLATGPSSNLPLKYNLRTFSLERLDRLPKFIDCKIFLGASSENFFTEIMPVLDYLKPTSLERILVLDNWVNYDRRFLEGTPDSIIVFDDYALRYARNQFPLLERRIELVQNFYLDECKSAVQGSVARKENIVFIESSFNNFTNYLTSTSGTYCICYELTELASRFKDKKIIYRKHPSGHGASCLDKLKTINPSVHDVFTLSKSSDLLGDLMNAHMVVGLPSYALYVAMELNIETYMIADTNLNWHGPKFSKLTL